MNHGSYKRKRLFVSRRIQGLILCRLALYWVLYHAALWVFVSWDGLLLSVGESLGGNAADVPSQSVYLTFFLYSSLSCAVAVLPFVMWDMLKLTHRVAGPLYKLQMTLDQLVRGEKVESIRFRRGDLLIELQDAFNRYLASRGRVENENPPTTPEPQSGTPGDECLNEEGGTIEADLDEIERTLQDLKPVPTQHTR